MATETVPLRHSTGNSEIVTTGRRMGFYFGLIAGLPPGVPGGGTTGMLSPEGGGVCFICGSTPIGGVMTPPERLSSELLDPHPLAGGTAGALGCLALSSSAATATVTKPKNAIARSHILPIAASKRCPHPRQTLLASAGLPASTTTSRIKPLWPVTKLSLCPYCASRAPLTMILSFARQAPIDEVIMALPLDAERRRKSLCDKMKALAIDVRLSIEPLAETFNVRGIGYVGTVPVLEVVDRPLKRAVAKLNEGRQA